MREWRIYFDKCVDLVPTGGGGHKVGHGFMTLD